MKINANLCEMKLFHLIKSFFHFFNMNIQFFRDIDKNQP